MPASLSLQISTEYAAHGTPVTVTARLTAAAAGSPVPTGSVQFIVDGLPFSSSIPLRGGQASVVLSSLGLGAHRLSASYSGDVSYAAAPAAPPAKVVVMPGGTSRFVPLQPVRLLDTRPTSQVGYAGAKPGDGAAVVLQVTGRGGVPVEGVTTAVMNVTMTEATGPGFVTAYPSDAPRPLASNVNAEFANQTIPNLTVVPVSASGTVTLYLLRSSHLVVDVQGYFTAAPASSAGRLVPMTPSRLLDTRPGPDQVGHTGAKPAAGSTVALQVAGRGGVPGSRVDGVVLNVTATGTEADAGFVTVYPADRPRPLASNVNMTRVGQTIPNAVWSPLSATGAVNIYVHASTDLVVDVAGWFTSDDAPAAAAGLFVPLPPTRVLDTRQGGPQVGYTGPKPPAGAVVPFAGSGPATSAHAVVANVTTTEANGPGFATVYPAGSARPLASNLNMEMPGQTRANLVMSGAGSGGTVAVYLHTGSHVVADVAGYFVADPDPPPPVTQHETMTPAANTTVLEPAAARSVNGDATTGYVMTLAPGTVAPAVGAGLVLKGGGAAYPSGLSGTVSARSSNPDGTFTLTLAPAPIDQLVNSLDIGYEGPASLVATRIPEAQAAAGTVPPAPGLHAGEAGGVSTTFDASKTIFDGSALECNVNGGLTFTAAVVRFENTRVRFEKRTGLFTTPFVQFYLTTEPIVEFSGEIHGSVSCDLSDEFRRTHRIVWVLPTQIPVTVDLAPAFKIEATVAGRLTVREHFYRMVGVVTQPDLSVRTYNAGSRTTEAREVVGELSASILIGADVSVKLLDVAGLGVTLGPKFTASVDTLRCRKLNVGISAAFDVRLDLWIKQFKREFVTVTLGPWTLYQQCGGDGSPGGDPAIMTATLPGATLGEGYSYTSSGQGGQKPYRWSAANLPPWAAMRSDGTLEGVPAAVEERTISVTLTDAGGRSVSRALVLKVTEPVTGPPPAPVLAVSFSRLSGPSGMSIRATGTCPVQAAPAGTEELDVHFRFNGRRVSVSQYMSGSYPDISTGAFSIRFYFYENVGHHQLTAECWARVAGWSSFDPYIESPASDFVVTEETRLLQVSGPIVEGGQMTAAGSCPAGWGRYEALSFSYRGFFDAIVLAVHGGAVQAGGAWGPHSFTVPAKHDGFNDFYLQGACYGGGGDSDRVFMPLVGGPIQSPP